MSGAGGSLWFETPTGPVRVEGAAPLITALRAQAPDWPAAESGPADAPAIEVEPAGEGRFRFRAELYDTGDLIFPPGLVGGNGLIGALIHSFCVRSPDWICLHAGAVEIGGRLTVLVGDMMAGKSTLSVALAALGRRLFTDDRLPVGRTAAGFEGFALALRPKLRDPLPADAPAAFRRFAGEREGPRESGMRYVVLHPDERAPFGTRLPLERLVLLSRRDDAGAPAFRPVNLGETVKRLVPTAFAAQLPPVARLARLRELAESVDRAELVYADSFQAAELLDREART
ncbi:MAG: hypothetical protein TEF_02655 [Rhizobiales bacterium NRL2]|nr:MAG: hypothetical protein TEF_02655 [Rhizobiales bacterium NRL2]